MKRRILAAAACMLVAPAAFADEGGVSFWLPGQQGSFAAAPAEPGWSMPLMLYHTQPSAGSDKYFLNGGKVTRGLDAKATLLFAVPTYTFKEPVAGAQAAVGMGFAVGHEKTGVNATLSGPNGGALGGGTSESVSGGSDLYPTASLKWNQGVHNTMVYSMMGVPVGAYQKGRLANIGLNHWSLDAGGGYTYLNPKEGNEFSAVLGFTYNFKNSDTDYKNGVDAHLDWAASHFVTPQTHVGLVGYFYNQLTGDSGSGATLGDFKSRVAAIGPQVGYFFPVGGRKWYVNLKAYWEFNAANRPEGWNVYAAVVIPFGAGAK
ncbi:SphA family protein [Variovorax sp. HJSM1_2]|uniref:SphA family protein n=1 Tax=Variovorax sp. HJSM1_2 TaxID=3366263 RepID=UPI003BE3DDE7